MSRWLSRRLWLASLALAALSVLYACGSSSSTQDDAFLTRSAVSQYRQWTRVNPQPVQAPAAFAMRCAGPLSNLPDVHKDKYITVFVNDAARSAMLTQLTPKFPQGSVIVKQKSATPDGKSVELLTVMVKREAGFNPTNGDWEYAVLNGSATQVQAHGALENCQGCHVWQKSLDYIFRDAYLPQSVSAQLK